MEIQAVLEQVRKDEIKFITLQFTDLLGVIKEVIIPVEELEDALTEGVWFDGCCPLADRRWQNGKTDL
jgi:glutamine synthetase